VEVAKALEDEVRSLGALYMVVSYVVLVSPHMDHLFNNKFLVGFEVGLHHDHLGNMDCPSAFQASYL
jgi:glyoxylase-like metal-dependent hydrolase (beta-lactamase superfamily II)